MPNFADIVEQFQRKLFQSVVSNQLVYNTCWEDPRLDRAMLQLNNESQVLLLTSAGDNALDYLLDKPQRIDCVDKNPAQNALLDLKKVLFQEGNFNLLWELFGEGKKTGAEIIYQRRLRHHLSPPTRAYWDQHMSYFTPTTDQPSFYFRGTSGKVALMIYKKIKRKGLYPQVLKLLNARSLEEQSYYFEEIEPKLWSTFHQWLVSGPSVMTMLGVPASQQKMIKKNYNGGLIQYIRQALTKIFTRQPLNDNYFWRVYLTGSYTSACCPNYLREQSFVTLSQHIDRLHTYNSSLLEYLEHCPRTYTHVILLDHQDWLAGYQPKQLASEWRQILTTSAPGTRILFRSVAKTPDFLPEFVTRQVHFQPHISQRLHQKDRVGTYESTHLGIVQ